MALNIFEEDEVYKITKDGVSYGLVLETAEYTSSDEEEENFNSEDKVRKGSVRVAWHPDGGEEVVKEDEIKLADRSLMPGDVVRRLISGENSQRGYVMNMNVTCHLQILGTNTVICDVDSKDLLPIQDWDPDPGYVTLDSWVGRIVYPQLEVILKFADGARLKMPDVELTDFIDINEKRDGGSEFGNVYFYQGQQLEGCGDTLCFRTPADGQWLHETKAHNPKTMEMSNGQTKRVTVEEVVTKSLEVQWMCRGYARVENPNDKIHPPPRMITGDELKRLKRLACFEHCSIQIGDKCYYKLKETDEVKNLVLKKKQPAMHFLHTGDTTPTMLHGKSSKDKKVRDKKTFACDHEWDFVTEGSKNAQNVVQDEAEPSPEEEKEGATATKLTPGSALEAGKEGGEEEDASSTAVNIDGTDEQDDLEDGEYDDLETDSEAGSGNSSGSENTEQAPSKKRRMKKGVKTRSFRKRMTKRVKKRMSPKEPRTFAPGDVIPAEVIYTLSTIDVMWQDATVESGIPSPQLFPIHHLDELEFFPGDFVIDAKVEGPPGQGQYGVVMSVDHRARTCIIKWMKPYQVGKGNKPDESIEPDEVSVYDIKDHPDYKFRPDQVVVRVGGYEDTNSPMEAAGQICQIHPNGSLEIQWANGSKSNSYPQEIFLVSDEMSEIGSSEYTSSEDEDDSMCSWETEEEETQSEVSESDEDKEKDGEKDGVKESKESDEEIPIRPEDKVELDQLLDKAKNALEKLEGLFSIQIDISPQAAEFYKNILHVYRNCQDLDRILGSSFFSDQDLTTVITKLRKEVKKEKRAKMTQQVMQLFEQNLNELKNQEAEMEGGVELAASGGVTEQEAVAASGDQAAAEVTEDLSSKACSNAANGEAESAELPPKKKPEGKFSSAITKAKTPGDLVTGLMEENVDVELRVSRKKGRVTIVLKPGEEKEQKTDQEPEEDKKRDSGQSGDESDALLSQVDALRARELCERACHCLKFQIQKVQDELDKIWQKKVNQMQKNQPAVEEDENSEGKDEGEVPEAVGGAEADPGKKPAFDPQQLLSPLTPDQSKLLPIFEERFSLVEETPEQHRFKNKEQQPQDPKTFFSAVKKEIKLLRRNLPAGIKVKGFEDRMDLYSILIVGPAKTPYEDGLFLFDIQLPNSYPSVPPAFHYISFCSDRMNPNLYEDGKVCVSLLGTWGGKGTELWNSNSTMLQVLISIQGLILNAEPYYNEAGFERQRGTQQGMENSKVYNEMAILKLVESMMRMIQDPPIVFKEEILDHLHKTAYRMINRMEKWIKASEGKHKIAEKPKTILPTSREKISKMEHSDVKCQDDAPKQNLFMCDGSGESELPEFPLLPASRGLCITLQKRLDRYKTILETFGITGERS